MSDPDPTTHWYGEAVRCLELLGRISVCIEATRDDAAFPMTTADAIARITQLLDDFHAETIRPRGGTR